MKDVPIPLPFEYHEIAHQIMASMMGAPFRHMGRDPRTGLDCLGQLWWFHRRLGVETFIPSEGSRYPRDFWRNGVNFLYLNKLREQFAIIPTRCAQFGDVYLFDGTPDSGKMAHVGIVDDPSRGTFQHVFMGRRVEMADLTQRWFAVRFRGVARHMLFDTLHPRQMPNEVKR